MKRFSQIYCKNSSVQTDSPRFRTRLSQCLCDELNNTALAKKISKTLGLTAPIIIGGYDIKKFIAQEQIRDVLDTITIAYHLFGDGKNYNSNGSWENNGPFYGGTRAVQNKFANFVNSCFSEENLCYKIDDEGVVHYAPDEEFLLAKTSTLMCLNEARYQAVAKEFIRAYEALNSAPPDTKASAKAIFESVEILFKLMTNKPRLTKDFILDALKPLLDKHYADDTSKKVITRLIKSFCEWVEGMQWYRHGQKTETPNDPPLELAILTISTGTGFLRWLALIDAQNQ